MFGPSEAEPRPLPPAPAGNPSDAAGSDQAGVCGDAAAMVGRPARPRLRIKRRRLEALQRVSLRGPRPGSSFLAGGPCPDPPRPGRPPNVGRGVHFASSWPAGTAPARQNSPPPAGQNSVCSGHPFERKVRALSHGGKGRGKRLGDFFGWGRLDREEPTVTSEAGHWRQPSSSQMLSRNSADE